MTKKHHATDLQMIPVDQIAVLNPRDRNGRAFEEIVGNIKSIGLKKPVTVTPRDDLEDGKRFLLICGEGRLKAFRSLGEKEIPALVVAVNDEDAFIMSLTENIARRKYSTLELLVSTITSRAFCSSSRKVKNACWRPWNPDGFRSTSPSPSQARATRKPCRLRCRTPTKAANCAAGN